MRVKEYLMCALAGLLLINALPHVAQGVCGHSFPTPFAHPPGQGLSSAPLNVAWGFFNAALAYVFLRRAPSFAWRQPSCMAAFGVGALVGGMLTAVHFGRLFGGV